MESAGLTDVGQFRKNNEDNFAIDGSLLLVADGMGGAAAGEIASTIAVDIIKEKLGDTSSSDDNAIAEVVKQAIVEADSEIKRQTNISPEMEGMGTTVVLAIHFEDRVLVANVGDSRAYLVTEVARSEHHASPTTFASVDANAQTAILQPIGLDKKQKVTSSISRISEDHSVVMDLVNSGVISEEEIRTHPLRNRITRCVGSLRNDGADVTWHDIHNNDVLILCSDGLWEMVHEDIILAVTRSSSSMEEACRRLVDAANDAGGADNITVIAATFREG